MLHLAAGVVGPLEEGDGLPVKLDGPGVAALLKLQAPLVLEDRAL